MVTDLAQEAVSVRVALVEDESEFRNLIAEILRNAPGVHFLDAFESGESAVENLPSLKPEVVIMDLQLPGIDGVEATRRLKKLLPSVHVLIFTVFSDSDHLFEALKAGASGYLLKRASATEIVDALFQVREGGSPMSPAIARKVVQSFHARSDTRQANSSLTERENEILGLMSRGMAAKETASQLGISVFTVRFHIRQIYRKLYVKSQTQAIYKYRNG